MKILVTGLGRSGTSLMMRMLNHGGVLAYCDRDMVTYETAKSLLLPKNHEWMKDVKGAVKIIDPVHHMPPPGEYKIIWMSRHFGEQAKSFVKLMKHQGKPANRNTLQHLKHKFKNETANNIIALDRLKSPLLRVRFENLIMFPHEESLKIKEFLSPHFKVDPIKMRDIVIERDPQCYKGFLETEQSTQSSIFD